MAHWLLKHALGHDHNVRQILTPAASMTCISAGILTPQPCLTIRTEHAHAPPPQEPVRIPRTAAESPRPVPKIQKVGFEPIPKNGHP